LKDVKVDLDTLNEEQRREIEDKCFASWVAEIDPETKSSEITGKYLSIFLLNFRNRMFKNFQ